ncbi:hypothetical protein WDZ16_13065 [Pseudokineococcus marinus]|uniref:Uncharacterized protein n=1 Tax=Pseudokineococcus marinus TaxID=351215 RepID=A0A849BQ41_9ACTN|nr:hypothetical protein [Pseudokineococcus marinus]NNH21666.1 hypothetical protein [Pseudokineococcus marinus]
MLTGDERDQAPTGREATAPVEPVVERRTVPDAAGSPTEVIVVDGVTYPARSPYLKPLDAVIADGRRRGRRRLGRRPR